MTTAMIDMTADEFWERLDDTDMTEAEFEHRIAAGIPSMIAMKEPRLVCQRCGDILVGLGSSWEDVAVTRPWSNPTKSFRFKPEDIPTPWKNLHPDD